MSHPYNGEYLWHVVPGMLFDNGHHLTKLLEEVLAHVLVTCSHHTQKRRHHLWVEVRGQRSIGYQQSITNTDKHKQM